MSFEEYREDAKHNGFVSLQNYAKYRVALKRRLREHNIAFTAEAPLHELEELAKETNIKERV